MRVRWMNSLCRPLLAALPIAVPLSAQATWSCLGQQQIFTGPLASGPGSAVWRTGTVAGVLQTAWWDGVHWHAANATGPSARDGHAMAFDPLRARLVLFGGRNAAGTAVLGDLWEFDGTNWLQRVATGPQARYLHAMAWDAGRSRIVIAAGSGSPATFGTALDDLWEWDGTSFSYRLGGLGARIGAAMAYDPLRGELVVAGGHDHYYVQWVFHPFAFNDTRVLGPTAQSWTVLQPATLPGHRSAAALAFDPTRGHLVLAGGTDMGVIGGDPLHPVGISRSDVMEWTGSDWLPVTALPDQRTGAGLAFDAARGEMVLAGGAYGLDLDETTMTRGGSNWNALGAVPNQLSAMSDDPLRGRLVAIEPLCAARTFEWSGGRWRLVADAQATPPAGLPALCYDPARQCTVMMPCMDCSGTRLDTLWSWDGASWTLLQPSTRPGPRRFIGLGADLRRNVVVLYGGEVQGISGDQPVGDVWEWDGVTWRQTSTAAPPGARSRASLSFDARRGVMLLYGGLSAQLLGDTWEYDGVTWLQVASTPVAIQPALMAWDAARARTVLYGAVGVMQCVTYEHDGASWTGGPTAAPAFMQGEQGISGTYDAARERIVAFVHRGTWVFETAAKAEAAPYGVGCAASTGVPALAATSRPWIGDACSGELTFVPLSGLAMLTLGWSDHNWGSAALPLSLAAQGAPGCLVWVEPSLWLPLPPGSSAAWSLAVPNVAVLAGLQVFAQGVVFDPAANALGLATSNALRLRLGIR